MIRNLKITFIFSFIGIFLLSLFSQVNSKENIFNNKALRSSPIMASFVYLPSYPSSNEEVCFIDNSTGNPTSWLWNFGDGYTSSNRNPKHKYKLPKIYFVSLKVSRGELSSVMGKTILVKSSDRSLTAQLRADFIYEPENPKAGQPIKFYDRSTGRVLNRIWQFGYFDFSMLENPIKIFYSPGKYAVSLSISNQMEKNRIIKYIEIGPSPSNIVIVKSVAFGDVREAVSRANPGDTVLVPEGKATWSSQLIINKGIILKGAGVGKTVITADWSSGNYTGLIKYEPVNESENPLFRLTGFEINGDGKSNALHIIPDKSLVLRNIRIDHNKFYGSPYNNLVIIRGHAWGVVDNNEFIHTPSPTNQMMDQMAYNVTSWDTLGPFQFGTADNMYYEDNVITVNDMVTAAGQGGRYCFRYNTIYYVNPEQSMPPLFDAHGNQTGGIYATMGIEIYGNTIISPYKGGCFVDLRGGKALIYNNNITANYTVDMKVREEYLDSLSPTTNPQPQHISDSYIFNNTRNGSLLITNFPYIGGQLYYSDEGCYVPSEDIHFWKHNPSFNGTSGVGVGPLSQRPVSCTKEGVAWWATDENKLYRWKNGRWELYYTPYTYPHPLRIILND